MREDREPTDPTAGTTSRRDALKLTGVAALGGVAAALAATAAGEGVAGAASTPAHVPTSLHVSIDGVVLAGVRSMEVLSGTYATAPSQSGGATGEWAMAPTAVESQVVSFTRYFTGDPAFAELYQSQNGQPPQSREVSIRVEGRRHSTANQFTLSDCFPVSWSGPSYDAAVMAKGGSKDRPTESITIAFQKIVFT